MTSPVGSQLGDLHLYVWLSLPAPLEQPLGSPGWLFVIFHLEDKKWALCLKAFTESRCGLQGTALSRLSGFPVVFIFPFLSIHKDFPLMFVPVIVTIDHLQPGWDGLSGEEISSHTRLKNRRIRTSRGGGSSFKQRRAVGMRVFVFYPTCEDTPSFWRRSGEHNVRHHVVNHSIFEWTLGFRLGLNYVNVKVRFGLRLR